MRQGGRTAGLKRAALAGLLALPLSWLAAPLLAQQPCRLALALALDVSTSVDAREYALQRDGLAAALDDPDIRGVILNGGGPVALSVYEWSGRYQQAQILPWVLLSDNDDIDAAVARIAAARRAWQGYPTAMGYALGHGAGLMATAPACDRQVIDLSGDGISNDGFGPGLAYRHFPFAGITVNGLAVTEGGAESEVVTYFLGQLRHGPSAFVEVARGYEDFRRAMTLKLFREMNDLRLGQGPTPEAPGCCG
ncbi:DUF1194 domain-containing protein [Pseudooceanicola marinus]|uniref:DUF1194 domain-containing protein n=1 Tax=Pseudooceanicola marinus TaxID=396013 RepID=UPI001CD4AA6C|nr:DUF1194 domain-containing protein [Pseudooceanicola marinus]MCA1336623.1 DUF1194 domain-containing protein [Pseudooceanicola marinus]